MGVGNLNAYNLFAYCENNPVIRFDARGTIWKNIISGIIHAGNTLLRAVGIDTAAIGARFLDMEEGKSKGVYHANFDCWQKCFGYNKLYDIAFDIGTDMEVGEFAFQYNNKGYTLWAWKGDYINLGAGAELGIYVGDSGHRTVDTNIAMTMSMVLYYDSKMIIDHAPDEKQWWITGFNSNYQNVSASDLTAVFTVTFHDTGMYGAFKEQWYGRDSRWTFCDKTYTATLTL